MEMTVKLMTMNDNHDTPENSQEYLLCSDQSQ